MLKRRIITFAVVFVLGFSVAALWSVVEGDEHEGDAETRVVAASGAEVGGEGGGDDGAAEKPKKKGNRFFRAFKSPFKAVGKLFDRDERDGKLARMTEKDRERFESVGVVRIDDGTAERKRATGEEGTALDHLERGRARLEEGSLNEAIAELSLAVSLDPRLARAHSLLAVAYDRKGLRERARISYERAVDANESDAQALNNLGYSLYLSGNYRAAIDRLKRAARLAPADARILNNLALAQARLGKFDDAYKNFARAGGAFAGHTNVAALLVRVGREEKAIEHLEAARKLQPGAANVLRQLAELYERRGEGRKAEDARAALRADDARRNSLAASGGE